MKEEKLIKIFFFLLVIWWCDYHVTCKQPLDNNTYMLSSYCCVRNICLFAAVITAPIVTVYFTVTFTQVALTLFSLDPLWSPFVALTFPSLQLTGLIVGGSFQVTSSCEAWKAPQSAEEMLGLFTDCLCLHLWEHFSCMSRSKNYKEIHMWIIKKQLDYQIVAQPSLIYDLNQHSYKLFYIIVIFVINHINVFTSPGTSACL